MSEAPEQLDLRGDGKQQQQVKFSPVDQYSERWAAIVRPLTLGIFLLLAAVVVGPFLLLFAGLGSPALDKGLDWAKTVLAPIVGFASAAVGYYYGTRQIGSGAAAEDDRD
jgi:hypothetical protein